MTESAYSLKFALKLLYDRDLIDESNIEQIAESIPLNDDGYILSSRFEQFSRTLTNET